jgi:hypothetical protein
MPKKPAKPAPKKERLTAESHSFDFRRPQRPVLSRYSK